MTPIIAWGSYDLGKPRVRLLLEELRGRGRLSSEISVPVWSSIRDKSVASTWQLARALLRLIVSYPAAIARLVRQPKRSIVLLPYPAIPDVFLAAPVAWIRGYKLIFDAFIPLHDTVVRDRRMAGENSLTAKVLWRIEQAALRCAHIILVDTDAHGDFYAKEFAIPRDRFHTVLVGAEPVFWSRAPCRAEVMAHSGLMPEKPIILFYGQLIPLHGLETIFEAIRLTEIEDFQWLLIGSGQDEPKLQCFMADADASRVRWIPWVAYERLPDLIACSDVALGIFGASDKASRVIPNKVFQLLAAGKLVITRSSPAVDPIATQFPGAIIGVPANDGAALAAAVKRAIDDIRRHRPVDLDARPILGPKVGIDTLLDRLELKRR